MSLLDKINKISEGYSEGMYLENKYGITKSVFNNHKSYKIYAKELKGNNFISLNYYITERKELLNARTKSNTFFKKCNNIKIKIS
jgi:peptide-methionine (S)-S-oxide reductase